MWCIWTSRQAPDLVNHGCWVLGHRRAAPFFVHDTIAECSQASKWPMLHGCTKIHHCNNSWCMFCIVELLLVLTCCSCLQSPNILFTKDWVAKIADVGLARLLSQSQPHTLLGGTYNWQAISGRHLPNVKCLAVCKGRCTAQHALAIEVLQPQPSVQLAYACCSCSPCSDHRRIGQACITTCLEVTMPMFAQAIP